MIRTVLLASGGAMLLAACASSGPVSERPKVTAGDLDQVTAVLKRDFKDRGITWMDVAKKMSTFSAPVWMKLGLEKEVGHGTRR